MAKKINKIIIKGADWEVKKVDFTSPEMKASIENIFQKQQESILRKAIDPSKLKSVVKL
ncbi:MAG: hypothetical protein NVV82_14160 [Sporocytophaga sp.]|uniref:Uncharacterized protein n=1 Tax=Sporocytophaga myxococcoides TaxID=153721 RepID=A0A098LGH4_9BACT|nr:hypothetical protein [Sporocytophaga myxococcoides]MCR6640091.1 hypothetical protein [Sporocytophaga sp.]GAL85559.1 hypothetical protein MYP_2788 [Sporocytophaga myxococcoides]